MHLRRPPARARDRRPNPSVALAYIRENRHLGAEDGDYDGFLETGRLRLQAERA